MQEVNWNDLRYILATARSGAISTAARLLRVNETTVTRRIAHAEIALGSKLFERADGSLRLTESGQLVVAHAERIELEIEQMKGSAAGRNDSVVGTVRLTAIPIVVNRILLPAFQSLTHSHPGLRLELVADPRNFSLSRREADIALRFGRPDKEQSVVARRLAEFDYAVFGRSGSRRASLPWITYEDSMAALPHVAWINRQIKREGKGPSALSVNDSEVALAAIAAGAGKSLLPCAIGDAEPGLTRQNGPVSILKRELWMLVHPELKNLARIRAVIKWLDTIFQSR